jgi:MraZ protein
VAVFTSTFVNKIDRKGRVSVPAPFRNVLGGVDCPGIFIYKPFDGVRLEGCGLDRMTQMSDSLDLLEQYSDTFDLLQSLFADSTQATLDGEGRMILPEELRDFAGIDDTVTFVGAGPVFHMWSPEHYAESRLDMRERHRAKKVAFPPFASLPKKPVPA